MSKIKIPKVLSQEQLEIRKAKAKRNYNDKKKKQRICFDETNTKWYKKHVMVHHNGKCFCKRCGKTTLTDSTFRI